jgi:hypothetical protein
MSPKILQINYKFHVPAADLEQAFLPAAQPIADVPGLRWKVWLMAADRSEAGGIYLFDDEAAVNGFLNGPIVAALGSNPAVSDINAKLFEVGEPHSTITRAPLGEPVSA